MASFQPGFRTCCQPRTVWIDGHFVCLVEFWSCCSLTLSKLVMLWMLTFMLNNCNKCMMFSKPITRHLSIEDVHSYSMMMSHYILTNVTKCKIEKTWGAGNATSTYLQSRASTIRIPYFLSHGSFTAWMKVQYFLHM